MAGLHADAIATWIELPEPYRSRFVTISARYRQSRLYENDTAANHAAFTDIRDGYFRDLRVKELRSTSKEDQEMRLI